MPKDKSDLQKHTLHLFAGDFDELRSLFPDIEPSRVVRELVRTCIERKKAAEPPLPQLKTEVHL